MCIYLKLLNWILKNGYNGTFFFFKFILRERESTSRGGVEREREKKRERERERIPSRLHTQGDPNVGLKLTNHEIMT